MNTTSTPEKTTESKHAPNGRIAHLPWWIREIISSCLSCGQTGAALLEYLNSTPEFQTFLANGSAPAPLTEADLAEWREHGSPEWLGHQETVAACRAMDSEVAAVSPPGSQPLTERLAAWVAVQYAAQGPRLRDSSANRETFWQRLREFCSDISMLRRGDQNAEWLSIERQRLLLEEKDSLLRYKKKLTLGLEMMLDQVKNNPKAAEAFQAFAKEARGTFDNIEGAP